MKDSRKSFVLGVCHFVTVRFGIAASLVRIRRVAVKESIRGVVAKNDFMCGCVLDLDTLKPRTISGETLDAAKPARNRSRHLSARGQDAVRPAALRAVCARPVRVCRARTKSALRAQPWSVPSLV